MRWRTSRLFVAAAVVLAGCGAGDDAADVAEPTVAEAPTPVDDGSGGDATSTEVGDDASSQPTAGPQPPAVESVAVVEQPLLPGLDEMTLLSAADGGGSLTPAWLGTGRRRLVLLGRGL